MFFIKILALLLGATAFLFVALEPLEYAKQTERTIDTIRTEEKVQTLNTDVFPESITVQATATPIQKEMKKITPPALTLPLPTIPLQVPVALPKNQSSLLLPGSLQTPAATATPALSFNEINTKTRAALVNIICTTIRSGPFNPVSGSGVIIDERGVILTNAHVAQYFLLKDYAVPGFVDCIIRTGEPARNRFKAELLYIAPQWVERNVEKIRLSEPTGTGENDFALLLIKESTNPGLSPLPERYPAIPLDVSDWALRQKSSVLVAGYPAGFLGGISIQKELYPVSSVAETGDIYSFREDTPDVINVKGSPLAQQGASGGAVVSSNEKLFGLISTASVGATTGERELHAITGAHMEASFRERNNLSLTEMLAKTDLKQFALEFNMNTAPRLTKLLEDEINRRPE